MVSCSPGAWTPVVSWAWGKESLANFSLSPWSLWQESPWRKSLLVGTTALPSPCLEQCLVGARTERGNWVSMINKVINEARKVTKVKVVFFLSQKWNTFLTQFNYVSISSLYYLAKHYYLLLSISVWVLRLLSLRVSVQKVKQCGLTCFLLFFFIIRSCRSMSRQIFEISKGCLHQLWRWTYCSTNKGTWRQPSDYCMCCIHPMTPIYIFRYKYTITIYMYTVCAYIYSIYAVYGVN